MRIPRATYRVQLNGGFTFSDAAGILPYLDALGVSHLYTSPYTRSREGSSHGYDVVDHNELDPEIGGGEGYERLVAALSERGMGQVLDFVPNHMGIGPDNHRWLDVLENGPASTYAHFFDIDWHPTNRRALDGKVLLPVLGDHYRRVLEDGELALEFSPDTGSLSISYYEHRCPLDPRTYPLVIGDASEVEGEAGSELASLLTAFGNLPEREDTSPEAVEERARDARLNRERLASLYAGSPGVERHVRDGIERLNGDKEALHGVLEEQAYRLAYWRVSSDEINYRRFFSIDDLAGVRVEDERVFEAIHRLALELVGRGEVDGLRIDHIDGLYDPEGYLRRLQKAAGEVGEEKGDGQHVYLLVEKILAGHERLPAEWPVAGTTGYEFAEKLNGLFVDPGGEPGLERAYRRFLGSDYPDGLPFEEVLYRSKRNAMRTELASELNVLSRRLLAISEGTNTGSVPRRYDFTINVLREALAEVVAAFPVYRTYIRDGKVSEADRRQVEWAVGDAERRSDAADKSSFGFIRGVLLGEGEYPEASDFVPRFQQYTGPVMAKGMEDTALYVFNRLSSLNEVGGEPERFGMSVQEMHRENAERAREWPHAMLSTSTHDTKRGEDVRARIDVLSEMPEEWRGRLASWARVNRRHRGSTEERGPAPSRNDEYLLYQTLLGAWPFEDPTGHALDEFRERIEGYMLKAVREAEVRTSWTNRDGEYEEALTGFLGALLETGGEFMGEFLPFARRVSRVGALNSLSQTLVKLTAPGVPDVYQGNDLWDLSLVDPDNRRPVDYELRGRMLDDLRERFAAEGTGTANSLLSGGSWRDGGPKLHLTWRALSLRREREELFRDGEYLPLEVTGPMAGHVFSYARRLGEEAAITIAPRLYSPLAPDSGLLPEPALWEGTKVELPPDLPAPIHNALTGEAVRVHADTHGRHLDLREILASFPVALLTSGSS
ncbi:malto-oligosyltrehalose synthase [soil metagenome]